MLGNGNWAELFDVVNEGTEINKIYCMTEFYQINISLSLELVLRIYVTK